MGWLSTAQDVEDYSKDGLICQLDGDGGDAAYRTALYIFLCSLDPSTRSLACKYKISLCQACIVSPGIFIRHPDKSKWWSNPRNFSRDQAAKFILAMASVNWKVIIRGWLLRMNDRNWFHQNDQDGVTGKPKFPDIILPGEIANLIRGLDLKNYKWLLQFIDLRFFIDLLARKRQTWDYDSLMACDLIYAQIKYPTIASRIVSKLYLKTDFRERLRENYAYKNNGIEPLGELYIQAADKYLAPN